MASIKTNINKLDMDWVDVKNKCRTTVNKPHSSKEATSKFKKSLLISEHSPIRLLRVNWIWSGIKSWVATHYVRHHVGVEKWVSTQRSDRIDGNRDVLPQDSPVTLEMEATAQSLINMSRVRLCYQASEETRIQMEDLKRTLHQNKETIELSEVMVPNCIYRCGCPEFKQCDECVWSNFIKQCHCGQLLNIKKRYELYNEWFYNRKD